MGTKLRALYQRRKGRDLFDLWVALQKNIINCQFVIEVFQRHCQVSQQPVTRAVFEKNLYEKKQHLDFTEDVENLITDQVDWSFEEGYGLVLKNLIELLPGESWKCP